MKHLSTSFIVGWLAVAQSIFALSVPGGGQLPLLGGKTTSGDDDKDRVPGNNPLKYCNNATEDGYLVIEHVNLFPNPPLPGHNLTIEAAGVVNKDIEKGAYVHLLVKYGFIQLIQTTADLCEQIKTVDLECPLKKGHMTMMKTVELPSQIPPGKYTVEADVYSKDDEPITCLTAEVHFQRQN